MPDKIILGTIDRVENDVTVLNQENINEIIRQIFDNQVKLANYLSNLQSRYDNIESYIKTKIDEEIGTAINTEITNQIIAGVNGLHYAGVIDENKSEVHNYYRGLADSENNSPSNNIINENVRGAFVAGEGNVGTNHFQVITGRYAEINERALVAHGVGYSGDEGEIFRKNLYTYENRGASDDQPDYYRVSNHKDVLAKNLNFGTKLPDSADEGQIFYLIQEV